MVTHQNFEKVTFSQMFFGSTKKFKTLNLSLVKIMGKGFTTLKS